jgi:hypothetical protein
LGSLVKSNSRRIGENSTPSTPLKVSSMMSILSKNTRDKNDLSSKMNQLMTVMRRKQPNINISKYSTYQNMFAKELGNNSPAKSSFYKPNLDLSGSFANNRKNFQNIEVGNLSMQSKRRFIEKNESRTLEDSKTIDEENESLFSHSEKVKSPTIPLNFSIVIFNVQKRRYPTRNSLCFLR